MSTVYLHPVCGRDPAVIRALEQATGRRAVKRADSINVRLEPKRPITSRLGRFRQMPTTPDDSGPSAA